MSKEFCGCSSVWVFVGVPHGLDRGGPQSPTLPSNELFWNVVNWCDCGIWPTNWLLLRFKMLRKVRSVNSCGISPDSMFEDRSRDSKAAMLPSWGGISSLRALWDKFSTCREQRFPIDTGILPSKALSDMSIAVKVVKILSNVTIDPLYDIVTESW